MTPRGLEAARAVLVDGANPDHVAAQIGAKRQLVHAWATKLFDVLVPPGWVTRSVTLPADLMDQVIELEERSRAALRADAGDEA
jgi:hypothetical protein